MCCCCCCCSWKFLFSFFPGVYRQRRGVWRWETNAVRNEGRPPALHNVYYIATDFLCYSRRVTSHKRKMETIAPTPVNPIHLLLFSLSSSSSHTQIKQQIPFGMCACVLSTPFKICVFFFLFFLFLSNRLPRPPSSHEQKKKPKRTKGGAPLSVNREVTQHLECVSPQLSLSSSSPCYIVNYTHIIQCWNCC